MSSPRCQGSSVTPRRKTRRVVGARTATAIGALPLAALCAVKAVTPSTSNRRHGIYEQGRHKLSTKTEPSRFRATGASRPTAMLGTPDESSSFEPFAHLQNGLVIRS